MQLTSEVFEFLADKITNKLSLNIEILQSEISPARMEALYGKLWESDKPEDLDKYHKIRKIDPLEKAFAKYSISCWASGVRKGQTKNRQSMSNVDFIRERLTLRPLLNWNKKDIFYYMEKHRLPQHPLFEKGYSTIGDWHSSEADNTNSKGRSTRFGGLSEECGIHLSTQ